MTTQRILQQLKRTPDSLLKLPQPQLRRPRVRQDLPSRSLLTFLSWM